MERFLIGESYEGSYFVHSNSMIALKLWLFSATATAFRFALEEPQFASNLIEFTPPLYGTEFSALLPFFPLQASEFRANVKLLKRFLKVEDLGKLVLISPCPYRSWTIAAATCSEPPKMASPEEGQLDRETYHRNWGQYNRSLLNELEQNGGRLDQLTVWKESCHRDFLDFIPAEKIIHACDDAVVCGKVRGCYDDVAREKRRFMQGWYIQQIIKLGVSRWITSPHMLVLDADAYPFNTISSKMLIAPNGASRILSSRHLRHSVTIGSEQFGGRWSNRYGIALDILKAPHNLTAPEGKILGVTPQTLSTKVVRELLDVIEERHQRPWYEVVGYSHFTEFTLYNTYLLLNWDRYKAAHDNSANLGQLAIWSHDLDPNRLDPGIVGDKNSRHVKLRHAIKTLRSRVPNDGGRSSFVVCQDETGLFAEDCTTIAERCHEAVVEECNKPNTANMERYWCDEV